MQRYILGACTDPIFIILFPACSVTHSWLLFPVFYHWITGDPPFLLSLAISNTIPLNKLWIKNPFPLRINLHFWLNLLCCLYWIILVSGSNVELGTSKAFPEFLLIKLQDWFKIGALSILQNLNIIDGSLGLNLLYLRIPYKHTAVYPSYSHFIQYQSSLTF